MGNFVPLGFVPPEKKTSILFIIEKP